MWIEESRGERVNHLRTEQFFATGADTVVVSCPFCLQMFEEGIGARVGGDRRAVDLIELIDAGTDDAGTAGSGGPFGQAPDSQ